ncbi:MAG: hypothetical protein ACPGXL_00680 [Chitinophagales bacterium]
MGKSNRKKEKRKNPTETPTAVKTPSKLTWKERFSNPFALFIIKFVVFMIAFYLILFSQPFQTYIFKPFIAFNATIASWLLNLMGQGTTAVGSSVNGVFNINIAAGCDGLEPTMVFVGGVLFAPFASKFKLPGILVGTLFLLSINFIRIVSLYLAGAYYPDYFDLLHEDIWQVGFIMLAIMSWLIWVNWVMNKRQAALKPTNASS